MGTDVLIYTDDRMLDHVTGPGHPERPERLEAAVRGCRKAATSGVQWRTPSPVDPEALQRAHTQDYLALIDAFEGRDAQLDPDTPLSPGSVAAAKLSAGACIDAVNAVIDGESNRAFALCRPPGHHAERDHAMGFCLYSNVAVAALHALDARGLKRVLIVDWDVHHGNGTQHILEAEPRAAFFSMHEFPLFPGTGAFSERGIGPGAGWTLNVPLTAGQGDAEYAEAFDRLLTPFANRAKPELILISAGFDAHIDDPLGSMRLSTSMFAWMCERLIEIADRHGSHGVVLALEGGYSLSAMESGCEVCLRTMLGEPAPGPERTDSGGVRLIRRMADSLTSHEADAGT